MKKVFLQLFASIDEIITANAAQFEGTDIKDQFSKITEKLTSLGYDVLINDKKKAEFVPSSRLSEVVASRDNLKGKVEELNIQLEKLKKGAGDNEQLKLEYQKLIDQNNSLLQELEQTKVNSAIMVAAKDAINVNDLLLFINREAIKLNAKGEVLGVEAEIARLKTEKPYLFNAAGDVKKGGTDSAEKGGKQGVLNINSRIRRAAGYKA